MTGAAMPSGDRMINGQSSARPVRRLPLVGWIPVMGY